MNERRKVSAWLRGAVAAFLAALGFAEELPAQVVKDLAARQRYPWNNLVDIDYTIEGVDDARDLEVRLEATEEGTGRKTTISTAALDQAPPVTNGRHRVTWNPAADGAPGGATGLVFAAELVKVPRYLVVDLSGGANASSYPVSYLDDVPAGGWTSEYKTTKLVMRRIPAGTFTMGSPANELGRYSNETQHEVTLAKPYYIGVFEVTQKQWELVMGSNPSYYKGDARPVEYVSYNAIRGSSAGAGWPGSAAVDAGSFLGKLRARTGVDGFDLPTEAQWEYACRAGTTTALNTGENLSATGSCPEMDEAGRYSYNRSDGKGGYGEHTTAGSYPPNAWGLYDMHGNVYEWCLDWYGGYGGAATDPKGAGSGSYRVLRGGGWFNYAQFCRSAIRDSFDPSYEYCGNGFRLSRIAP